MDEKEIFNYLKNNMIIQIDNRVWFGGDASSVEVKLLLVNPETGKHEVISESSY